MAPLGTLGTAASVKTGPLLAAAFDTIGMAYTSIATPITIRAAPLPIFANDIVQKAQLLVFRSSNCVRLRMSALANELMQI
jgi:hypothetical protein